MLREALEEPQLIRASPRNAVEDFLLDLELAAPVSSLGTDIAPFQERRLVLQQCVWAIFQPAHLYEVTIWGEASPGSTTETGVSLIPQRRCTKRALEFSP